MNAREKMLLQSKANAKKLKPEKVMLEEKEADLSSEEIEDSEIIIDDEVMSTQNMYQFFI